MKRIQFPNLNGVRFLAAFGVIIHHIEQVKSLHGLPNIWNTAFISNLGGHSVSLFFVLSGFLITFLLKEEAKIFASIDIKKFYIRRALRIWPLYFTICFLGFIVLPMFPIYNIPTFQLTWGKKVWLTAFLYCMFSPHLAMAFGMVAQYAGVLWSVGVEEWFYAIWPWIIKYIQRHLSLLLVALIVALSIARTMLPFNSSHLGNLLFFLRFDCMAIGGLFAILLSSKHLAAPQRLLSILYRTDVQLFTYVFLAIALVNGLSFGPLGGVGGIVYSGLFGMIILNLAANKNSILELELPIIKWLGEISYGLYCYNWIAIMTALLLLKHLLPATPNHVLSIAIFIVAIPLTIMVSALSYEFIERRFLLLKGQSFTRVPTATMSESESSATVPISEPVVEMALTK